MGIRAAGPLLRSQPPPPPGERGYPRPQLQRASWYCLNGPWDFALDPEAKFSEPRDVNFNQQIEVPFAPETRQSGIGNTGLYRACWYRREISVPTLSEGEHLMLHFGAVDYHATVFVNGIYAGEHEGGYTPFSINLTRFVRGESRLSIQVRAFDDPEDLAKPRGKQDWQLEPHAIWYPRTTGIWQTVWLERLPRSYIERVRWAPDLARWEFGFEAHVAFASTETFRIALRLRVEDVVLVDDVYTVVAGEVHRRIALSDPGIDDYRNNLLWSPESPTLVRAELTLLDAAGQVVDSALSYTALRSVAVQGDRFILNGRPYPLRMVLDQGYWPDTGMTAPDDAALRRDAELVREMGFNGVRKHQKIEDPRYLFWADRLGILVWEEMPSAYRFTRRSVQRLCNEWTQAILRDVSHPCIVAWVPFNESWGVPNLPDSKAERHYVQALYHLTSSLDPTRPVVGNDGWESSATDIVGVHDYDANPERLGQRYFAHQQVPHFLQRERPGGRVLVLEGHSGQPTPIVLSEFGGIALSKDPNTWGYATCTSSEELEQRFFELLSTVNALSLLAGYCYTQFADTYQEANGLLNADRSPKFPLERMAAAVRAHALVDEIVAAQLHDPRGAHDST
jgi:beta-galactosidase/beta-glucuronidase